MIDPWWGREGLNTLIRYLIHHCLNTLDIIYWMKERWRWGLFSLEEWSSLRWASSCSPPMSVWGSREGGVTFSSEEQSERTQGAKGTSWSKLNFDLKGGGKHPSRWQRPEIVLRNLHPCRYSVLGISLSLDLVFMFPF